MRIVTCGPPVLPLIAGAAAGLSIARLIRAAISVISDPGHYRAFAALERAAALASVPTVVWALGGMAGAWLAWHTLAGMCRRHGTVAGWVSAIGIALPMLTGVVLMTAGEPLTRPGRFLAVAGVGFAGPGTLIAWCLVVLCPLWRPESWRADARCVWSLSMVVIIALGAWMAMVQEPTGDEPSYLLAMHSLAYDHDLDVADNHARQDYRYFYPTTITHGQMLPTRRGVTLPKHSLGLPVLGVAAYRVAGRMGVSVLCSALVAAYAACIYHMVERRRGPAAALRVWSVCLLCAPLVLYAGQIYPNATVGLLTVAAMVLLPANPVLSGVTLGAIPWFHLGSWPLAFLVLAVLVLRDRGRIVRCAAGAVLLWGGLVAMHWHFWGSLLPPAGVYGSFAVSSIPGALAGILLDQEAGIMWIAPVWLLAAVGAVRRGEGSTVAEALIAGAWLVYISSFNWWFGGWSPTGRFLLPVVGVAAVLLADGITLHPVLGRALWVGSGIVSIVLVAFPFFRFNAHDGVHSVLDAVGRPGHTLAALLPSVVEFRPAAWGGWILAAALVVVVCRHARRPA